jgi:hypothetical protein
MRLFRRRPGRWSRSYAAASLLTLVGGACADSTDPGIEIVLSQPSVDFRAIRGTTAVLTKSITIENSGDGRLGPVSCPANPAAWLTCTVSSGNTVTLSVNPSGLTTSPATATVPLTAAGAPDNPVSVDVNLIIDQPTLTISASTVSFTSAEGGTGTTPGSATVNVTNTGAGTLANLGAITCVPTPVNARVSCVVNQNTGAMTLTVDPSGLAPGTHVFPVTVSAPNDDVSKTISVTLALAANPRISLSQQSLVFQTIRGTAAPAPQVITVSNSGGGSLGTVSCPANPATWLTCAVSGGGSTLTFTANPGNLTASPAAVTVNVSASGASNSPQQVTVNLNIRQPVLDVSATALSFAVAPGGTTTTPANAKVTVTNAGEGTLANLGTIACTPPDGSPITCAIDQSIGELTITVNPVGLVGTRVFPLAVSAPNSNVTRTITVTVAAAPGIALSPNELNFQAVRGSTVDIVKKVKVTNSGGGSLGTIACPATPAPWLTCANGTADTLVFTAKPTGLTASPAELLVPVTATGAVNSPQNVTVNFAILQPILTLSSTVVNVTAAAGATTAPAGITVTNTGAGGTLASLGTIVCTPSHARVSCTVNQTTGALTITVNTATAPALTSGTTHVFTATVAAPNAGNGQQTVTIVLQVT